MEEAKLKEVETYVYCCQNTVVQYIMTRPVMYLFMAAKRGPGPIVKMRWWEQKGLDLERMRTESQEAERA